MGLARRFRGFFHRPARPSGDSAIAPEFIGVALQLAGTVFEIYAKVFLGRSFGIVAADRGIVVGGPYRIVRHPIYLGYFVTHVGFLLTNWSPRNVALYIVMYFFQIVEDPVGGADSERGRIVPCLLSNASATA